MSETGDVRTYEIITNAGAFRIDVPMSARVTYGPIIGAAGKSTYGGNVLRIWQDKDHQLALFSDVTSFRDLSLPLQRQAVRRYGTDEWSIDDGSYHGKKAEQVEKKWVNVDDLTDRPPETSEDDGTTGVAHLRGMKPRANAEF